MTLEEKFAEMFPEYTVGSVFLSPYWDLFEAGAEIATQELQQELEHKRIAIKTRKARIKDLEKQIEKMKCCENCSNFKHRIDHRCNTECKNLSKWEMKE